MKYLAFVFVLAGLVGLSACNPAGCLVQNKVVDVSTSFVANTLECAHPDAVKEDLTKVVSNFGLCKTAQSVMQANPQGPLADTLCPVVSGAVVGWVAANGIPVKWGCTANSVSQLAVSKLTDLCRKIPASEFKP